MKTWLFTNTFYGTWLPGDTRGSVTRVRDHRLDDEASRERIEHNQFGTPTESSLPSLERAAREQMKGPPIIMDREKAALLLSQFQETAQFRQWSLICAAVMWNHIHWIATIADSTLPDEALAEFKAYGSRGLNAKYGRPPSDTWWTSKGSKRMLMNDEAVAAAINYVLNEQPNPLVTWSKH